MWDAHLTDSFLPTVLQWDVSSNCVNLVLGFLFSGILWQCVTYVKCRESFPFIEVEGPDIEYYIPFDKYV